MKLIDLTVVIEHNSRLDFSWKKDRTEITLDDVKKELERIKYELKKRRYRLN